MKLAHFNQFKPLCPLCLRDRAENHPLEINSASRKNRDEISEGILGCTNSVCRCEYPVIDGIPLIVPGIRTYISTNILPILSRTDLSGDMLSLIGDCCEPGSPFNVSRQHLSSYAFDHYGDLGPTEGEFAGPPPGSAIRLLEKGFRLIPGTPAGPVIDMGCSVGRTTFVLAERFDDLVVGVDLNFQMLKLASSIMNHGEIVYPLRRVGVAYDMRRVMARFEGADRVDFWAVDAEALPFADNAFGFAASLNLIDCLASPYDHLKCLSAVLRPQGRAILTTPYDWSVAATPLPAWLGGHSQRSDHKGKSEVILRSLLSGGSHPNAVGELELTAESDAEEWHVRLHDRSSMHYQAYIAAMQKMTKK